MAPKTGLLEVEHYHVLVVLFMATCLHPRLEVTRVRRIGFAVRHRTQWDSVRHCGT